jgi:hypothetical protein
MSAITLEPADEVGLTERFEPVGRPPRVKGAASC